MALVWEMKRNRVSQYFKGPLMILLGVGLSILTSWIFHVLFALYTREQTHMSLFAWIDHIFALVQ
jgi:hypothetical protein